MPGQLECQPSKKFLQLSCFLCSQGNVRTTLAQVVLMSATLDSDLLAQYFGNCEMLAAGGRTHPVEQFFLEDIFEITEYRLDAEGPAALKVRSGSSLKNKTLQKASTSKQKLVQVAFLRPL